MSPPTREAWIEMIRKELDAMRRESPPTREAWIEMIGKTAHGWAEYESPPTREAWIEMRRAKPSIWA